MGASKNLYIEMLEREQGSIGEILDRLEFLEAQFDALYPISDAVESENNGVSKSSSAAEKDARIAELSTTTRTQAATEARQEKVLENWKAAFKIMIPVILQCHAEGPKKRTRGELQAMCSSHGMSLTTTQLDFLRECLGGDHINTDGGPQVQDCPPS